MRLALVYRSFELSGSLPREAVEIARFLSREHDVHVFSIAARTDHELAPECTFHPVEVDALGGGVRFSGRELVSFARNAAAALARQEFDLVYAIAPSSWVADVLRVPGVAREEARLAGIPGWRYAASALRHPGDLARRLLEKRALRWAGLRRLHAHAPSVRDALVERYGFSPRDIFVSTPWVSPTFRPPENEEAREHARQELGVLDPETFVALFCGSDFFRKGLDRAVQAIAALPSASDPLLIVLGGGPQGRYRRLASELGIAERVRFLGARSDAWRVYQAADVLLLPTRADVWGVTPFEAMASGVPAIVSAAAGSASAISHGKTGLVLPEPFRLDDLVAALEALALDQSFRASLSSAGLEAARAHCAREALRAIADDLVAVVAGDHPPLVTRTRAHRRWSLAP